MNKFLKMPVFLLLAASVASSLTVGSFCKEQGKAHPRQSKHVGSSINTKGKELTMSLTPSKSTGFALKLFSNVEQEERKASKGNVLVSPFSAYAALAMTLNGTAGSTREEMAKVLGVSSSTIDELNARNKAVLDSLNAGDKVQLEVANAIYADKSTPFKQSFIKLCQSFYKAEIKNESFADPATVQLINSWCNDKTHGKIAKILDRLTRDEKMVLLNAIYFKGAWSNQFKKNMTHDDHFTNQSGKSAPVKMMHQMDELMFYKGKTFQSVAVPYLGHRQSMYIFLPNKDSDVPSFMKLLTEENWKDWKKSYSIANVNLSLPRFTVKYSADLKEVLSAMGMAGAFSRSANFTNLISQPAWISRVLQKTYMDVNEEGTEAAAVTAMLIATHAAMRFPEPEVEFRVDRPFVIALVDHETDEFLFIGSVAEL